MDISDIHHSTIIMLKGFSYLTEEVDGFLDILEEYLPISSTAWEKVAEVHLTRYPDLKWTMDSLKRKFKELHNNKNPTGDPLCPPAVCRAKHLRVEIINSLDASDLNSEEGGDSLEGGDAAAANLGGDHKDDKVGVGLEQEEDDFSTVVVGEDTSTEVGGDEGVDDAATARPSSQAFVSSGSGSVAVPLLPPRDRGLSQSAASQRAATVVRANSRTSGQHSSSSASSATGHRPPTHMTPLSGPWTQQQGNSPDSSGDRIGNIMAMRMMNQASDRDERRQEREERRQRILSADGAAASADATITEHDDDSVDECGRYDKSPTETVRFRQQQYH
jgi:hypothetical protein